MLLQGDAVQVCHLLDLPIGAILLAVLGEAFQQNSSGIGCMHVFLALLQHT